MASKTAGVILRDCEAYIALNRDGTYDAFVKGRGFRANVRLSVATAFIRQETGRRYGAVPFWNRLLERFDSEIDIQEGA